ncbi:putative glutamate transporter glutamate-binding protein [[Actinomadura] parvosata subsp. kistnae]|uniref:ABC transporter substrate-binding protein n=1 Tax=[Actinomadura] parvosata subsp. kistnae TaxID=1909395 RepID=A0A1V0A5S4_9ACTN|nr:glutamate ABC transporter substrate-binding protein [Nonomuraea sp. ATCC 55076]AQZ65556.1 ABC transporter substrate-binding protein [Nonomuraea sp. ATCC 55076]SPL96922.1 putative glutamate transporter glutamate-binding protein [Actinomadura parvosata subsp. kistnae]
MKRVLAALLVLASTAVAGCGLNRPESIVDKDELVIGVRSDLPSVGFRKPDGTYEGFDVDVARYLAARLGKSVSFLGVLAADREKVLMDGRADMVVATFTIDQERKRRVLFAGPYHISYQDILIRPDEKIANVRDLEGRRICEVQGSNAAQRVVAERGVKAQLVPFPDYNRCLTALKDKQVDAVTTNDVILAGLAARDGSGLRLANALFNEQRTGVGLAKGDVPGCEAVNRAITAMYQDGTAQKLLRKWFGASWLKRGIVAVPQFEGCS